MPSGSKFAIVNLAFYVKSNYKANIPFELMTFPAELIAKRNVVLSGFNDKKATVAYTRTENNMMVFVPSIDITPSMELDIIGTYQIN